MAQEFSSRVREWFRADVVYRETSPGQKTDERIYRELNGGEAGIRTLSQQFL